MKYVCSLGNCDSEWAVALVGGKLTQEEGNPPSVMLTGQPLPSSGPVKHERRMPARASGDVKGAFWGSWGLRLLSLLKRGSVFQENWVETRNCRVFIEATEGSGEKEVFLRKRGLCVEDLSGGGKDLPLMLHKKNESTEESLGFCSVTVNLLFIQRSVIIPLWASMCLVCGKNCEQKVLEKERATIVMLLCRVLAEMILRVHQSSSWMTMMIMMMIKIITVAGISWAFSTCQEYGLYHLILKNTLWNSAIAIPPAFFFQMRELNKLIIQGDPTSKWWSQDASLGGETPALAPLTLSFSHLLWQSPWSSRLTAGRERPDTNSRRDGPPWNERAWS